MGTIASNFGVYSGNNDDLTETFFDRSVLRHIEGGPRDIERIITQQGFGQKDRPLLKLRAHKNGGLVAPFFDNRGVKSHEEATYLGGSLLQY